MVKTACRNFFFLLVFVGSFTLTLHAQGVAYKDQSITISEVSVQKDEMRTGVHGVLLSCYAYFKYGDEDIQGAMESDYLRQYYFFLEIKRADNGDRIFYPVHHPDQENKESTFDEYFKVRVTNAGRYYIRIFIPFHHFQLIPGQHKVNISLSASDEKSKFYFRNLYQTDMVIDQPPTYLARIKVDKIKLLNGRYDTPANKIPFFGLFAGGKNSKAGQGLPDAGWRVIVGNDIIYESVPHKDALEVIPGTATFKIAKGDPVKLVVYDEDYFKSDQVLGTIDYHISNDVGVDERKNYAFEKIESSDILFEKTVIPAISAMEVNYEVKKVDSITGVVMTFSYKMDGLQSKDAIMLHPVFRDKNGQTFVPVHSRLLDKDLQMNNSGMVVDNTNGAGKFSYFIPHYACFPDMYPGVEVIMDDYDEVIISGFSNQKLKDFGTLNDDVKIYTGAAIEDDYKGYWGLKFPLNIDIPLGYYDDLKYTDIDNSVRIYIDDTMDVTNKVQIISMFGDTALGNFHMRKIRHDKTVHIPYSWLNLSNEDHKVTIYTSSVYKEANRYINKDTFHLQISNPNLVHTDPFMLRYRIRDKKMEKGYIKVYRGKSLLKELKYDEIPKGKKYRFIVDISAYSAHIKDEIRVEIIGVDYFGGEKVLDKTVLGPLQINYNVIPDRKVSKAIKGYKLRRLPKKKIRH